MEQPKHQTFAPPPAGLPPEEPEPAGPEDPEPAGPEEPEPAAIGARSPEPQRCMLGKTRRRERR